jgi:hypothetical protein
VSLPDLVPCACCGEDVPPEASHCSRCAGDPAAEWMACPECMVDGRSTGTVVYSDRSGLYDGDPVTCPGCDGNLTVDAPYLEDRELLLAEAGEAVAA